jgi:hypothetical protein
MRRAVLIAVSLLSILLGGCSPSHNEAWQEGYTASAGDPDTKSRLAAGWTDSAICNDLWQRGTPFEFKDWMDGCKAGVKSLKK